MSYAPTGPEQYFLSGGLSWVGLAAVMNWVRILAYVPGKVDQEWSRGTNI